MNLDHLSSDEYWDLVYETAKHRTRKKKLWNTLMSPRYAEATKHLAEKHINRISEKVWGLRIQGYTDREMQKDLSALIFIQGIRGKAIRALERHRAANRSIRRYNEIEDLQQYNAYLKRALEDLWAYAQDYVGEEFDFPFYSSLEAMKREEETQLEDWAARRQSRRTQ